MYTTTIFIFLGTKWYLSFHGREIRVIRNLIYSISHQKSLGREDANPPCHKPQGATAQESLLWRVQGHTLDSPPPPPKTYPIVLLSCSSVSIGPMFSMSSYTASCTNYLLVTFAVAPSCSLCWLGGCFILTLSIIIATNVIAPHYGLFSSQLC